MPCPCSLAPIKALNQVQGTAWQWGYSHHLIWWVNGALNAWHLVSQSNVHAFPSYEWNDKHRYWGDNTDDCWRDDGHINGHPGATRVLFPASTHREAEWSVSHSTAGETLLTLECAAVEQPFQRRLNAGFSLPTTTASWNSRSPLWYVCACDVESKQVQTTMPTVWDSKL